MESQPKSPSGPTADAINAGLEHHRAGRLAEADKIYRQVLVREPNNPDALHLLAVVYGQTGQLQTAIDLISKAIKVRPDVAQLHLRLAEFLRAIGKYGEAAASFQKAISLDEEDPAAHNSYGAALGEMRQFDAALSEFRRAIELEPEFADAHSNLGAALVGLGRLDDAIATLQTALKLDPKLPGAYNNLGNALYGKGEITQAIDSFNKVVELQPNNAKIHANLALGYLLLGDFSRGWREHEWRLRVHEIVGARQFTQPRWDGSDLNGKTILLHPEQGFGDMIQFARFIPKVAARGGKIILECPRELMRLFNDFSHVSQLAERGKSPPNFDVHCPLLSLGSVFNVDANTIPAEIPYLKPGPDLSRSWMDRFNAADRRLRVGLVWAGRPQHTNERNRSINLSQFAALAYLDNVALYSLQKGEAASQASNPPTGLQLIDWTNDLTDFADTAALINNLDLVLTVDTAVAHLAGAMGKRVWLMLPWIPDWRWMRDRPDSPWYPTMRLFRQPKIGDWPTVLQNVAVELKNQSLC